MLYVIQFRDPTRGRVYVPSVAPRRKDDPPTEPVLDPRYARKFTGPSDAYVFLESFPLAAGFGAEVVPFDPIYHREVSRETSPPAPAKAPAPVCPVCGWDTVLHGHDLRCPSHLAPLNGAPVP